MSNMEEAPLDIGIMYPDDTPVLFNGRNTTLGWYKAAEEKYCRPEDPTARFDPDKRNRYFARILDTSDKLLPEHQYLLSDEEA